MSNRTSVEASIALDVMPLTPNVGAEVRGVELRARGECDVASKHR